MKPASLVIAIVLIGATAFAAPKKKVIDGRLDDVFKASVLAAQKHWTVSFIDRELHMFSFDTGMSFTSNGMACSVSARQIEPNKVELVLQTRKKAQLAAWGVGGRIANKLFTETEIQLKQPPGQLAAAAMPTPSQGEVPPMLNIAAAMDSIKSAIVGDFASEGWIISGDSQYQLVLIKTSPLRKGILEELFFGSSWPEGERRSVAFILAPKANEVTVTAAAERLIWSRSGAYENFALTHDPEVKQQLQSYLGKLKTRVEANTGVPATAEAATPK